MIIGIVATICVILAIAGIWLAADRMYPPAATAGSDHQYRYLRQLIKAGVVPVGLVIVIIVIPISDSLRGQLLSLLGLVVSAIIALSSTTFVANAMAGVMLRSVSNFRPGDFIRADRYFGRVTERGLFYTEIQTQDRDLTTLPNLYLVNNPVTVVHASGTFVSAKVSIGYEVHHNAVKDSLLAAIEAAGLSDGYVRIIDLADHVVVYRAAGFLDESKRILLVRSRLREAMIDALHRDGIAIASPGLINYRRLEGEAELPQPIHRAAPADQAPDQLVFDKAEHAEQVDDIREARARLAAELAGLDSKDETQAAQRERLQQHIAKLDELIAGKTGAVDS